MQDIFVFEKTGVTEKGPRDRTLPRYRHPSAILRTIAFVRCANTDVAVPNGC